MRPKLLAGLAAALAALLLAGCSLMQPRPVYAPAPAPAPAPPRAERPAWPEAAPAPAPPAAPAPVPAPEPRTPRAQASLTLTEQGRLLLEQGQLDQAIGMLERAVGLNPAGGQSQYWLAEAWLKKGNPRLAAQYNRQAGVHLRGRPEWRDRVREQQERIAQAGGGGRGQ